MIKKLTILRQSHAVTSIEITEMVTTLLLALIFWCHDSYQHPTFVETSQRATLIEPPGIYQRHLYYTHDDSNSSKNINSECSSSVCDSLQEEVHWGE